MNILKRVGGDDRYIGLSFSKLIFIYIRLETPNLLDFLNF